MPKRPLEVTKQILDWNRDTKKLAQRVVFDFRFFKTLVTFTLFKGESRIKITNIRSLVQFTESGRHSLVEVHTYQLKYKEDFNFKANAERCSEDEL